MLQKIFCLLCEVFCCLCLVWLLSIFSALFHLVRLIYEDSFIFFDRVMIGRIYAVLLSCFLGVFLWVSSSCAIIIQVPSQKWQSDVAVIGATDIQWDEGTIFTTIQLINSYLWFSISVICMVVLIWWGIKLISAQWDEKKMAEANKLLLGALAWIMISLLSYALVRLVVWLF